MAFVVDASAILPLFLDDEQRDYAEHALQAMASSYAIAPILFWYEVRNAIVVSERRNRLRDRDKASILDDLLALPIELRPPPLDLTIFALAKEHALSLYDAAYLELAVRHKIGLATLDAKLASAASDANVELIGPTVKIA